MMFVTEPESPEVEVKGEGNYASTTVSNTRDQETDQGLTLSPKIQSENPYSLDLDSITHEDIERWLGPSELEMMPEEFEEDESWNEAIFNEPDQPDPEPPAKKRKLSTPATDSADMHQTPPDIGAVAPSSLQSWTSQRSLHSSDTTFERNPLILVDHSDEPIPGAERSVPQTQRQALNLHEDGLEIDESRIVCATGTFFKLSAPAATSLPSVAHTLQTPCESIHKYPLHSIGARSQTTQIRSQTPYTDALLQRHYSSLQKNLQPVGGSDMNPVEVPYLSGSHGHEEQESYDFGDDGSLFGDDGSEEPSPPSFSIADNSMSSPTSGIACVPFENKEVCHEASRSRSISSAPPPQITATPAVPYPSPSMSPATIDTPSEHIEQPTEKPLSAEHPALLKDYVHTFCKIPHLSRKAALRYAEEHGLYKAQPSKVTKTGASITDLTWNPFSEPPPSWNNPKEGKLLRLIASHLRAKLAATSSCPHMVPTDLSKLFESLEKKFDQDINFRNSVLTWAVGRMEAIGKDISTQAPSVHNAVVPKPPNDPSVPDRASEASSMEQSPNEASPTTQLSLDNTCTDKPPVARLARDESSYPRPPTEHQSREPLPIPPTPLQVPAHQSSQVRYFNEPPTWCQNPYGYSSPYQPLQPPPDPSIPNSYLSPLPSALAVLMPLHLPLETRFSTAVHCIEKLEKEKLEMQAKMEKLQRYAGYLECVNRSLPRPID